MKRRRWLCLKCRRMFVPYRSVTGRVRCTYCLKVVDEDALPEHEDGPRITARLVGIGNRP